MNYFKGLKRTKRQKGLKIHNIYNINHNKGMTSKLIYTMDNLEYRRTYNIIKSDSWS